jgi:glycogen debranching enzyme
MHCNKLLLAVMLLIGSSAAADGLSTSLPKFPLGQTRLDLHRLAQPATPFNKVGHKFALLGFEGGTFEAWAYPLKLFSNVQFSFLLDESTRPVPAREIVRYIDVSPAVTTLTFTFQSFVVKAHYLTVIDEPAAMILLEVDSTDPLTIICSFSPVLQPMWPAGLGGQYAYWNDELKAYLVSEPTRHNHALIGSPAAAGLSYTPAHMLSDQPNEFKIEIDDPEKISGRYLPIYMAGGKGERDSVKTLYARLSSSPRALAEKTISHYRSLLEQGVQIDTPESRLNMAYGWAKVTMDGLVVVNPDLGTGLVAGWGASGASGRPGFGWFFGGDAYINSSGLIPMSWHSTVCDALLFTQKWQRDDGKMAHELSQASGYINWFKDYPYAYIHGDTTPFYIVASHAYCRASHNLSYLRASWPSLCRAYRWCLAADQNRDGLIDNPKAGLGSVEYGALTNLMTDIYTGALSVKMSQAMAEMAAWQGDSKIRQEAMRHLEQARASFDVKFWDEQLGSYSNAFNDKNEHLPDPSPWISTAALFSAGTPEHTLASISRLGWADLSTDWGVRSISNRSKYYEPLNYNYGGVWPFLTGFVSAAQFACNLTQQAYGNLVANCNHTFINNLGAINELFSGKNYLWPQEAVSQQGFSSLGVILPLLQGLYGLDGDAFRREVRFAPRFPADWKQAQLHGYVIGQSKWSLFYRRSPGQIQVEIEGEEGAGYQVAFAPVLGAGAVVDSVRRDGKPIPFKVAGFSHAVQPEIEASYSGGSLKLEIFYRPGLELVPPVPDLRLGDPSSGIRFISIEVQEKILHISLQGIAGQQYRLAVAESRPIRKVRGARFAGSEIIVDMPAGASGAYVVAAFEVELAP